MQDTTKREAIRKPNKILPRLAVLRQSSSTAPASTIGELDRHCVMGYSYIPAIAVFLDGRTIHWFSRTSQMPLEADSMAGVVTCSATKIPGENLLGIHCISSHIGFGLLDPPIHTARGDMADILAVIDADIGQAIQVSLVALCQILLPILMFGGS